MKSRLLGAVCACFLVGLSTSINASLVVPAGLNPGDKYHVIFVTSTTMDATSTDITVYDDFVQGAADAAGIGISIGVSWLVVGSTSTVNALTHLTPLFNSTSNVPIYNQNGDLVSDSFDNLWDGSISSPIQYNENNNSLSTDVWSGTAQDGTTWGGGLGSTVSVVDASSAATNRTWIQRFNAEGSLVKSFYAMSEEVTVSSPVPVPAAVWLFGTGLLGLFGVARRKVRT